MLIIEVLATYACVYCTTQKFDSGKLWQMTILCVSYEAYNQFVKVLCFSWQCVCSNILFLIFRNHSWTSIATTAQMQDSLVLNIPTQHGVLLHLRTLWGAVSHGHSHFFVIRVQNGGINFQSPLLLHVTFHLLFIIIYCMVIV